MHNSKSIAIFIHFSLPLGFLPCSVHVHPGYLLPPPSPLDRDRGVASHSDRDCPRTIFLEMFEYFSPPAIAALPLLILPALSTSIVGPCTVLRYVTLQIVLTPLLTCPSPHFLQLWRKKYKFTEPRAADMFAQTVMRSVTSPPTY